MLKLGLAAVLGGAGFAAGYFFHRYMLAPAGYATWASQGSPWVTGAIVAVVGVIAALIIKKDY